MNRLVKKYSIIGLLVLCLINAHAANIIIVNQDTGTGLGFDDPTAATPEGGNSGTTRGAQRLIVFQTAARLWAALLKSNITIKVGATFHPNPALTCSGGSGVLGQAGPAGFYTFGAPLPSGAIANTWYPVALREALAAQNRNNTNNEIDAEFNDNIDTGCIQSGTRFWYGIDPAIAKPNGTFSLLPTLLHELGHGLGFITLVCSNPAGCGVGSPQGSLAQGTPDIWTYFLADLNQGGPATKWKDLTDPQRATSMTDNPSLVWTGANVTAAIPTYQPGGQGAIMGFMRLYAPTVVQPGSSVSHWTNVAANPNLLMEPSLQAGVFNDTDLTYSLFQDIGWSTNPRDSLFNDGFDTQ